MVQLSESYTQRSYRNFWFMKVFSMRIIVFVVTAFAMFISPEAGAAEGTKAADEKSLQPSVVFVDLPIANEDGTRLDNCPGFTNEPIEGLKIHRIVVDEVGNTLFDAKKITEDNFEREFKAGLPADGLTEIQIWPNPQAKAKFVLKTLDPLMKTEFRCYGFVNNEKYRQIFRSKSAHARSLPFELVDLSILPNRAPTFDPIVVIITSTDIAGREPNDPNFAGSALEGRCRAYYGGKPVSSKELVDLASAAYNSAIDKAVGVEEIRSRFVHEILPAGVLPDGHIVADPNTPWRCVGGVIFNFQISGFLGIPTT